MQKSLLYLSLFCATNAMATWQHPQFNTLSDSAEKQLFQGQATLDKVLTLCNFKRIINVSNRKVPSN